MKLGLLDLLVCPYCRHPFDLVEFIPRRTAAEVNEGLLACPSCGRGYPIINGIPRVLPDELVHIVRAYHGDFFQRFRNRLPTDCGDCEATRHDRWWQDEHRTLRSYSYQWRKFNEMLPHWKQVFLDSIRPVEPAFFHGKLGLDAGCGFGRSLYYAASYGAEIIGMDLSEAVESARANTRHLANVHVVQADIFHPPLRQRSLDFVYSIGVLHHLPDPNRGFFTLSQLLRPGAPIVIWVYSRGRGRQIALFTLARALSTRLPLRVLDVLCLALAAGQWVLWILPYRLQSRFEATRGLARRLPFTLYAAYSFRVLHADWFDGLSVPLVNYYRREEIVGWFREANLERVRIDRDWGGRALGYAPWSVTTLIPASGNKADQVDRERGDPPPSRGSSPAWI